MELGLKGKNVVIIGAGSVSASDANIQGIGTALVHKFAEEGANVFFTFNRNKIGADDLTNKVRSDFGDKTLIESFHFDATKDYAIDRLVAEIKRVFNSDIDIFIYSAGVRYFSDHLSDTLKEETYRVNYQVPKALSEIIGSIMISEGKKGVIIHVSSCLADTTLPALPDYCKSKRMLMLFSQKQALEVAGHGIRVIPVMPGITKTPMTEKELEMYENEASTGAIPLRRLATSENIADVLVFLASARASYISGRPVYVDGGRSLTYDENQKNLSEED